MARLTGLPTGSMASPMEPGRKRTVRLRRVIENRGGRQSRSMLEVSTPLGGKSALCTARVGILFVQRARHTAVKHGRKCKTQLRHMLMYCLDRLAYAFDTSTYQCDETNSGVFILNCRPRNNNNLMCLWKNCVAHILSAAEARSLPRPSYSSLPTCSMDTHLGDYTLRRM